MGAPQNAMMPSPINLSTTPPVLKIDVDHRGHVGVEQREQVLGLGLLGALGEADDIGEQDREMTLLAAELQTLGRIEQRRDDVGIQVMLEGGAQVALLAAFGDVPIAGQEHVNEHRG